MLLCLFPLLTSLCAAQSVVEPEWAVFSLPLKWEAPPPQLNLKIMSAEARIRVFFPTGEYGEVYCYLIRHQDGHISISRGDGDVVGVGNWVQEGSRIEVNSRIVYRTVIIIGKPIPEPETTESVNAKKGRYWTVWDEKQRYSPLLQFRDWVYLATLIRCDREYFDGEKQTDGALPCMPTED